MVKSKGKIEQRLIKLSGHNFIIPSLAIHLQRDGEGMDFNLQKDLLPVVGLKDGENSLQKQREPGLFLLEIGSKVSAASERAEARQDGRGNQQRFAITPGGRREGDRTVGFCVFV
jgi:aspartyl aminopeptidase